MCDSNLGRLVALALVMMVAVANVLPPSLAVFSDKAAEATGTCWREKQDVEPWRWFGIENEGRSGALRPRAIAQSAAQD
jgi:hypothetical protein